MIDWSRICLDLRALLGSCRQIARLVNSGDPDYIGKLCRGEVSDPRYSLGVSLVELYRKHIGDDLPMAGQAQQKRLI